MPNTGKPSRDCHLCRQRRVKCDLARPACQRCIKYGTECPGYRDQQELVFRNAYPTSIKRRKNRQQQPAPSHESSPSPSQPDISTPALHPDGDFVFTSSTDVILANGANRNVNLPLTRPVYEHWTTHSVPIILNVYGNLDFIKNIYRDSSANGPLVWAAHLFSRTYVTNLRYSSATNRDSSLETQHELSTYLGKTLSSVSAALKTPDGTTRDDVLATVWILSNYELLVGSLTRTEPMSPWHLHARGLYSILKSRGSAPLYTATGRTAFWPAYNMIQIQALVNSTECPAESEEWFNIIEDTLYPGEGLTLYISIFISKITSILSRILNLLRRRDFPAASREYPMLFTQLTEADQNLNDWIATHHVIEHTLDVYMLNLRCSALIKGYHMMQLLINFLTYYPPCPTSLEQLRADRAYCLQTVQIAAKTILESVPYALGPLTKDKDKSPRALFDALKLIWPLISVFIITSTRPEQKLAAEGILSYIGREMGVRQALKTYEGRVLLPPEAQEPLGEKGSNMADIMEHRLSIPIIDLGPTRTCSVKDTSKAAKELYEAFKNVGFAYVKNHDVPEEVLNEAFRWSHQFFNLPQSDKDKAPHPPEAWHHRGYSSIGREKLSQMVFDEATLAETRKVPDTKESFDMGRDDDGSMPNVWMPPDMLPGFKEFYMEFYEICYALQLELLRLVAVGMGLDKEYFVPLTNNGSII